MGPHLTSLAVLYKLFHSVLDQIISRWIMAHCFALKCKHRIGLTPLYWPLVGRRTRAMSGEVFYGRTVRQLEGSRTAKGIVGRRTADERKFLLLFRTALNKSLPYTKYPADPPLGSSGIPTPRWKTLELDECWKFFPRFDFNTLNIIDVFLF